MKLSRFSPLPAFAALLLAACGSGQPATVTYDLAFNVTTPEQIENLTNAAMRVAERRMDNMGVLQPGKEFGKDGTPSLVLTLPDQAGADELTRQLTAPFSMKIMKQTPEGATPDLESDEMGKFSDTGISTLDFVGVEAGKDANGVIGARITLTPQGAEKLRALYAEQNGKQIGVFIRNKLIVKIAVTDSRLDDDKIDVPNIPNVQIAEAFMDDVNVGLHVVYTPRP